MKYRLTLTLAILATTATAAAQDNRAQDVSSQSESQEASASAPQGTLTPTEAVDTELQEPDPGEEIVCRRERVTGSLTRIRRTCLTRNEWNNLEARTRDALNETNRNASGGKECVLDQFGGC